MKRSLPPALGVVCFLLLGAAAGFVHRVHCHRLEVLRVPVEHAAGCLEALVLLRQERAEEAAAILRRHAQRFRGGHPERVRPAPGSVRPRLGAAPAGSSALAVATAAGGSARGRP